jgi:hypothetical protein
LLLLQVNNLREIQALRRLSPHPHIIQLLEVLYDQPTGRLALVFELMVSWPVSLKLTGTAAAAAVSACGCQHSTCCYAVVAAMVWLLAYGRAGMHHCQLRPSTAASSCSTLDQN